MASPVIRPLAPGAILSAGWTAAAFAAAFLFGNVFWGIPLAAAGFFAWHKPFWFWGLLLFITPIARSPRGGSISPDEIAVIKAALMVFLISAWSLRHWPRHADKPIPRWTVALFLAWTSLGILSIAVNGATVDSLLCLLFFTAGAAAFWRTVSLPAPSKRKTVMLILLAALAASALGILQYVLIVNGFLPSLWKYLIPSSAEIFANEGGVRQLFRQFRVSAAFTHPNHLGVYLALLAPYAVAATGLKALTPALRWCCGAASALFLTALFFTNSRGSFLACGAALGLLGLHRPYRWIWGCMGAFAAAGFAVLAWSGGFSGRVMEKYLRTDNALSGREVTWRNGLELIRRSPWLGVSPGRLSHEYVSNYGFFVYNNENEQGEQIRYFMKGGDQIINSFHLHNMYLQMAGELGIAAPFLFLLALVLAVGHLERRGRALRPGSWRRGLCLASSAMCVALSIYGLFDAHIVFRLLSLNLAVAPLIAAGLTA